jgi:transposase InsO family protein
VEAGGTGLETSAAAQTETWGEDSGPPEGGLSPARGDYDFMFDKTIDGRSLKILTVVDEYTREALAIAVGYRMTAAEVIGVLHQAFTEYGWPEYLRSDNGTEFVAEVLEKWLASRGVRTHHIDPASPWQNAYGESFNDKLRNENLNVEGFFSDRDAQAVVEAWRLHYNHERPHSSLDYQTPAEVREEWERTRKELSFSPAPGSLRSPLGEAGEKEKLCMVGDRKS